MPAEDDLERARAAYARRAWKEACEAYARPREAGLLTVDDYEQLMIAPHLLGREEEHREVLAEAYQFALRRGERLAAARFAYWLSHSHLRNGASSQGKGWLARTRALLSEIGEDCVEWGYLTISEAMESIGTDPAAAARWCEEAREIALRLDDPTLLAMSGHALGRALIRLGQVQRAMELLDETIVIMLSGNVHLRIVGDIYCGVLTACHEVLDVRRATEWTETLGAWCDAQPELVNFRGTCLVRRAEVMQLHGQWERALEEAQRAQEWLALSPDGPADAFYLLGELLRLRGDFVHAEAAYRKASQLGKPVEPGLPLLWLATGRPDAARGALERALAESVFDPGRRGVLTEACIEVSLETGDLARAARGTDDLARLASELGSPLLRAAADRAAGQILLAKGDAAAALGPLRRAFEACRQLAAPYLEARTRVLIASACTALGDTESARIDLDAAREVFEQLRAAPDVARVDALRGETPVDGLPGGLTPREVEVLRQLAAGLTNKEIGATLVISEHTVARHVQNMLAKLDCPSRTALAAFAVQHGLAETATTQN